MKDVLQDSEDDLLKKISKATSTAQFDYRIYDELKEIKKELR